jgi:hypothetical protein
MQPPTFFVDPETSFVIMEHFAFLQGGFDHLQYSSEGESTLLTGSKHTRFRKRRSKQVAQDLAYTSQGEQMQTGQIHCQRLDVGAILCRGCRESIWQIGSCLRLTAWTCLHFDPLIRSPLEQGLAHQTSVPVLFEQVKPTSDPVDSDDIAQL